MFLTVLPVLTEISLFGWPISVANNLEITTNIIKCYYFSVVCMYIIKVPFYCLHAPFAFPKQQNLKLLEENVPLRSISYTSKSSFEMSSCKVFWDCCHPNSS